MSDEVDRTQDTREPSARWRAVFATAACFFLLTSSGRMGSSDSYTQLQAAVHLVRTGSVATDDPKLFNYCSVPGPDGRYYQAHDPGNIVLLTPSAIVASLGGGGDAARNVPIMGRLMASLTYALVGAACVTAIYLALSRVLPPGPALAAMILAGCGTPLWVYARCTMDVLPAAFGTGLAVVVLLAHADGGLTGRRAAVLAALAIGMAGWFRVSLLPFLAGPALLALLWNERSDWFRIALLFGSTLAACLAPVLAYNYIRSGNPLVLGTMHPKYAVQNGFAGDFATGLYGLLVSPNHGLFVFAPWLLLALTPAGLRGLGPRARVVVVALLAGAVAYTVLIAGLKEWGKPEWGPRYLVPIVPIVAVPAAVAAFRLWESRWRPVVIGLAVLSIAVAAPAGVTNYSYIVTDFPGAADPLARGPRQILGSYHALLGGLAGREQVGPALVRDDPERAGGLRFPDLWTARLFERGGRYRAAGLAIVATLLVGLAWGIRSLSRPRPAMT